MTNVNHVMERKANLMKRKSGVDVPSVKVLGSGKDYKGKTHLVLAPTYVRGKNFALNLMGWKDERVAVITDPDHIRGCRVDPGEDVYILKDTDGVKIGEFIDNLNVASDHFKSGESYNLKIIT